MATKQSDLIGVISEGTMRAAALIAQRANITHQLDLDKLIPAIRAEIQSGYAEAARDAHEALNAMGEPMARATLNASINLMAGRALRAAGYLEPETPPAPTTLAQRVDQMFARADQPTGNQFVENTVLGLRLTTEGWQKVGEKFPGNVQTNISQADDSTYTVLVSAPDGHHLGSVRLD